MIREIYNFIFAPPFDGFGPLVVNVSLLLFISHLIQPLPDVSKFYIGLLCYPLLVFMRKKCEELSDYKLKDDNEH